MPTREAFRPRNGSLAALVRPHHLYACESGSPELRRHLEFRRYLAAHPERVDWLAREQRRAAAASPTRGAYINAVDIVSGVMSEASGPVSRALAVWADPSTSKHILMDFPQRSVPV